MTVPVVLAISGGLLLFIGIIGGGVNMLGKLNVPQEAFGDVLDKLDLSVSLWLGLGVGPCQVAGITTESVRKLIGDALD